MMTMKIYQLNEANKEHAFQSLGAMMKAGVTPKREMYDLVWEEEIEETVVVDELLEDTFTRFNIDRPDGFKGHSLSVSDVIELIGDGSMEAHFVNTIGFFELTAEWDAPVKEEAQMMTAEQIEVGMDSLNRSIEWKNENLNHAINKLIKHLVCARERDAKDSMKSREIETIASYLPNILEYASALKAENEKLALVEQILGKEAK